MLTAMDNNANRAREQAMDTDGKKKHTLVVDRTGKHWSMKVSIIIAQ